jgi:sarcosine oxidase subunit gamma
MIRKVNVKMTDDPVRHHGLESFLQGLSAGGESADGIKVAIRARCRHFNLRGNTDDRDFIAGVEKLLRQALPDEANTFTTNGEHIIYWLGPDEWLVITNETMSEAQSQRYSAALGDHDAALNDLSGGQVLLRLSGARVEKLLAKGCPIDLHESAFPVGACAQSGLAKANVLIARVNATGTFDVVVRRSFSDYLLNWLAQAGSADGIDFLIS